MGAVIVEDPGLRDRVRVYEDRAEAGEDLARHLMQFRGSGAIVLSIPSGGVPVGLAVSSILGLPFDLLIIRKIPVPGDPESGLGAVGLEGEAVLNEQLVRSLGLSPMDVEELAEPVREELYARNRIFRGSRAWPEVGGRSVILVDDGLASGYTMLAAASVVRRRGPERIVVAVPTASASAVRMLSQHVEMIVCPNIRSGYIFAVADAYRRWHDLERSEVLGLLRSHGYTAGRPL
ncbi:MAG: phosphoribosyltransferase family protein [Methanothrix sp.]|nr:phosphoribosyltransferase family protein [Methanothrix sp.]